MIYMDTNSEEILFPRSSTQTPNIIRFRNQTTKKTFDFVITGIPMTRNTYTIDFTTKKSYFDIGQFDYWIMENDTVIDNGVLQYGDFVGNTSEYTPEIQIVQYNPS